jgi:hypothetical protein
LGGYPSIRSIRPRIVPDSTGDTVEFGFTQSMHVCALGHRDILSSYPLHVNDIGLKASQLPHACLMQERTRSFL